MVCNRPVPALDEPLSKVLGGNTAKVMAEHLDLRTVGDLLHHYPRRYAERGELTGLADLPLDEHVTVVARVADARMHRFNRGRGQRLEVTLTDGSGRLQLVFFGRGAHVPQQKLLPGRRGMFAGKVGVFNGRLQLAHPQYELLDGEDDPADDSTRVDAFANRLLPIYPACAQLPSWKLEKAVDTLLRTMESGGWRELTDPLPETVRQGRRLLPLAEALTKAHHPRDRREVAEARSRLKWDEAFVLQTALARRRQAETQLPATPRPERGGGLLEAFDAALPFTLTGGQRRVSGEILADLATSHPMHRLLQGEVGSGKAQPLDAGVLTPSGYRPIGDLRVGDPVITPSGEIAPVDGVFPQGERDIWRLELSDGSSVECDDEHLWIVGTSRQWRSGAPPSVLTTRRIREELLAPDGSPVWYLPEATPVDLDGAEPRPLDAHLLGTLLVGGTPAGPPDPAASGPREALAALGVDPSPRRAAVPGAYRNAPLKERLALTRGLLDTAGEAAPDGHGVRFRCPSPALAGDLAWLVRSLGGWARVEHGPESSEVTAELPAEYRPFRSERRTAGLAPRSGGAVFRRAVRRVVWVGRRPARCISVRHPEHAYVTDHFTVTHNTMVALRAMLTVADAGGQSALLAPTEVLAQQHHRSITEMLGELAVPRRVSGQPGTKVVLLTGSMGAPARRQALLDLTTGEAGLVIGTHALIEDRVTFHDLGLVVVDEQHRFGVEQRDALRAKGEQPPHLLVMTATPIPRTVAMTVFGDLETSVLDELPSGRSPIATHVVPVADKPHFLTRAWERVREEVAAGHQAYVVCPRIGDEEEPARPGHPTLDEAAEPPGGAPARLAQPAPGGASDGESESDEEGGGADGAEKRPPLAVLEVAERLAEGPLSGLRVAALHGRMPPDRKDELMRRFTAGELDVLVATTVIEVGVNVPNATAMVIMDADRFGVSQLHQLRGRVGRGSAPGLCLLVTEMPEASPARARLAAVASTLDGFELSRVDLEQRREGDVLGQAQSGVRSSLRMLTVIEDEEVIAEARQEASALVAADPELDGHPALRTALTALLDAEREEYLDKG
ncbi:DEAD/DEAH box helicase [Streptomyces sp. AJS327]|uniref:helicase-related protein n=1 Tax=Streptomyces sp. AJS327 TaxID=2545265 RepID=UPI0015DE9BD2|nr:helicase-related protein [Streptomyces sp. AJS327]MBA0051786.1 DEAD/DEAH box helicase [Streptomyces sp. AJS327]